MKKWICIQVIHHNDVGKTIEQYQKNGWHFNTYQATGTSSITSSVNHYLLFERNEEIST